MVVSRKQGKHISVPSVYLNGDEIQHVESVKYLGVILHKSFDDTMDIQRQLRSLYACANTILHKFARCSFVVKSRLIETYALNFYCSYLWCNHTKQNIAKIRVAYNNIYRKILGVGMRDSASNMFVSNRIDSFDARYRKSCCGFMNRVHTSTNGRIMQYSAMPVF
jgi:hypothetical protein